MEEVRNETPELVLDLVSGSHAAEPSRPKSPHQPSTLGLPGLTTRDLWFEVAAVLAVGVIPSLAAAFGSLVSPGIPTMPYSLGALYSIVRDACLIYVTLYLIHCSGSADPTGEFGIVPPRFADVFFGFVMLAAAEVV